MREILFRGKQITDRMWVVGGIELRDNKVYIVRRAKYRPSTHDFDVSECYLSNPNCATYSIEVDPETVGQFTGLIDENGDKIFEGDIVYVYRNLRETFRYKTDVEYLDGGFSPFANPNWSPLPNPSEVKIIGNIHDNPELLERK